jgi:hypothetical protein
MAPSILIPALALLVGPHVHAFTTSKPFAVVRTSSTTPSRPLFMSDDPEEKKIQITSGRKEIAYDSVAGRFFETNLEEEECIPEEEYCIIDDTTGKPIRLTLEEKERIFLDSLQVCTVLYIGTVSITVYQVLQTNLYSYIPLVLLCVWKEIAG